MEKKCRNGNFRQEKLRNMGLIRKTWAFWLFVCLFQLNAYMAFAQDKRMDISLKDATLEEVFQYIRQHSEYRFVYDSDAVKQSKAISVELKNATIKEILDVCLRNSGFGYILDGNLIIVREKASNNEDRHTKNKISGQVTDVDKQPLPGVTVRVKGLSIGTATDSKGNYQLSLPEMETLYVVFSFVGMETKEIKYEGQDTINVQLREAVNEMDEVNVISTGYTNVNRKDMVGSYTMVKAEDIMMPAYSTIDQMLQGQVPGMIVRSTSARAGTSPKIQIRGTSTLLGNQDPIWVVDGIIQDDPISLNATTDMTQDMKDIVGNQISWLNPNDIETITVLKDASATAIYGSRASNGVIVITTKKGKIGRMSINYAGNLSISPRPRYSQFKLMNSQERIQFSEEAYETGLYYQEEPLQQIYTYEGLLNMYQRGTISGDEFIAQRDYLESVNTDWLDLLTRTTLNQSHNLSVSGASEKINYTVSAGYNRTNGQEKGNSNDRLTGRVSVGINLRENINVNLAINGTIGKTKSFTGVNPLDYALSTSRAIPAFNPDGSYAFYRQTFTYRYNSEAEANGIGFNVLNELENSGSEIKNSLVSMNLNFSWKILDWLEYQFTGSYSYSNVDGTSWQGERSTAVASAYRGYDYGSIDPNDPWFSAALMPFGGVLFTSSGITDSYNIQNKILFSKQFNENQRLNAMVAMEVRSSHEYNDQNTRWGYVKDRGNKFISPLDPSQFESLGSSNLSGFGVFDNLYKGRTAVSEQTNNFFSLFATLAYSLKNRYVFNFNVRNDISNRFGQDVNKRIDPTYSLGASWRITEEPFMQNQEWLSALNLKVTWGIQGNALTNQSPELILYQQGVANLYNEYYSTISQIPNPNLSWEKTHTWNFGVDMQLFRKVNVTMDYYLRRSNSITTQDIALENGRTQMSINGGIIYNEGVECTVALTPINTKNFGLNLSVNSSKNWNSAGNERSDREPTLNDYLSGNTDRLLKKGYPIGAMWSFAFNGLNPENGWPTFKYIETSDETTETTDSEDVDPTSFLVYSGQSTPDFTGGLNLNIRYRSFTLGTSFSVLLGGKTRLISPYEELNNGRYMPSPEANVTKDLLKRWKEPGDELHTNIPGFIQGEGYLITLPTGNSYDIMEMWNNSDERIISSSFLRCRGLNLSWQLNKSKTEKLGLTNLRITMSVNNLFVIASKRFEGYDPELGGKQVMPKNYSIGLNIGF